MNGIEARMDAIAATDFADSSNGYLILRLGGRPAALDIQRVQEVVDPAPLTPVPRMPEFLRGVMNLRGSVVTVVDLGLKLGLGPSLPGPDACVVLVSVTLAGEATRLGIPADAVREVAHLPPDSIHPAPSLGLGIRSEMVRGVAEREGGFLLVLDLDRALADLGAEAAEESAPNWMGNPSNRPLLDLDGG
ncbi:MAG: chemotaxis protein CheW [Desulfococcaceae bacterium]